MATVHRVKQAGVDDVVYTSNTEGWENRAANHEPAVTKPYDMHYTTAKPGSKPQDSDYKSYDGSKFDAVKKAVEDGEEVWLKFVKYTGAPNPPGFTTHTATTPGSPPKPQRFHMHVTDN